MDPNGRRVLHTDGSCRHGCQASAVVAANGDFWATTTPGTKPGLAEVDAVLLALEIEPGPVLIRTDYNLIARTFAGWVPAKIGRYDVSAERMLAAAEGRDIVVEYAPSRGLAAAAQMRMADYVCRFAYTMRGLAGLDRIDTSLLGPAESWPASGRTGAQQPWKRESELEERFSAAARDYLLMHGLYDEWAATTDTPRLDWRSGAVRLALTGKTSKYAAC